MPLFEFECTKCRDNIESSLKALEKKRDKKTVTDLVKKHDNIHSVQVVDIDSGKVISKHGKEGKNSIYRDFYQDEGETLILLNINDYRFQELIFDETDEKSIECTCGEKKRVEKVVSSFAFTSDLSTNMPKPDLGNLPASIRNQVRLTEYIEEKDRPKKNR